MADSHEAGWLERIEAEARKVPPLPYVLFLFAVATCPFWISATVAVVAETLSTSLPPNFFSTVRWATDGGMIVSFVVTAIAALRAVRRRAETAEQFSDLSSFQLGWGAVREAWSYWWSLILVILFVSDVIAGRDIDRAITGVNRAELSEAGGYWFVIIRASVLSGFFLCFIGFCIWLGRRIQKQRAAL